MTRNLAYLWWGLPVAGSLVCLGIFLYAVWNYHDLGDARVSVELTQAGGWRSAPFRLTGQNQYSLNIEAVNHTPPFDVPWTGVLEVRISRPDGETWLQELYGPGVGDFRRPDNLSSERLVRFGLGGSPWRAWHVHARVLEADPRFAGVRTEIRLRREHEDYGLFSVVLFMMIIPAALLWAVSIFPAMQLVRAGGSRVPCGISVLLTAAAFLAMLSTLVGVPVGG